MAPGDIHVAPGDIHLLPSSVQECALSFPAVPSVILGESEESSLPCLGRGRSLLAPLVEMTGAGLLVEMTGAGPLVEMTGARPRRYPGGGNVIPGA